MKLHIEDNKSKKSSNLARDNYPIPKDWIEKIARRKKKINEVKRLLQELIDDGDLAYFSAEYGKKGFRFHCWLDLPAILKKGF